MSEAPARVEPKNRDLFINSMVVLGMMAIFAIIVSVTYLATREDAPATNDAAVRLERLNQQRLETPGLMEEYTVINAAEGKVRLPIERAMHLVVEKYGKELPASQED